MPLLLLKHCSSRQIQFIADASGCLCYLVNFITLTRLILEQLSAPLLCPCSPALFLFPKLFVTPQTVEKGRLSKTKLLIPGLCVDTTQIPAFVTTAQDSRIFGLLVVFCTNFLLTTQCGSHVQSSSTSSPTAGVLGEIILTLWLQKITKKSL